MSTSLTAPAYPDYISHTRNRNGYEDQPISSMKSIFFGRADRSSRGLRDQCIVSQQSRAETRMRLTVADDVDGEATLRSPASLSRGARPVSSLRQEHPLTQAGGHRLRRARAPRKYARTHAHRTQTVQQRPCVQYYKDELTKYGHLRHIRFNLEYNRQNNSSWLCNVPDGLSHRSPYRDVTTELVNHSRSNWNNLPSNVLKTFPSNRKEFNNKIVQY